MTSFLKDLFFNGPLFYGLHFENFLFKELFSKDIFKDLFSNDLSF